MIKCWNLAGELNPKDHMPGEEISITGTLGILGIYHKAINNTQLAGPTYFSGILRRFKARVVYEMS